MFSDEENMMRESGKPMCNINVSPFSFTPGSQYGASQYNVASGNARLEPGSNRAFLMLRKLQRHIVN